MNFDKKYVIFVTWKINPEKIGTLDPKKWQGMLQESRKISKKFSETMDVMAFEPLHVGFGGADVIATDDISEFYALQEELHQKWEVLRGGYATVTDVIVTLNRDFAAKVRAKHGLE